MSKHIIIKPKSWMNILAELIPLMFIIISIFGVLFVSAK